MKANKQTTGILILLLALAASPGVRAAGHEPDCEGGDASNSSERRRPGAEPECPPPRPKNKGASPRLAYSAPDPNVAIPDRWRIIESLLKIQRWYDPYNQNTIKADKPIHDDWFLNFSLISDTILEPRSVPTPVGPQTTTDPGSIDIFGGNDQIIMAETVIAALVYYKGDTVFRPPDYEFRLTLAFNYNRVHSDEARLLTIDPRRGTNRTDHHTGVQELFADKHLRNVSDRYDFDSIRVGIQPFNADFRGFLFNDVPMGIRLFGNRDNNKWQYNLGWFRRVEKDTNSGLNDISKGLRDEDIFVASVYRQDWPKIGFFSQATIVHTANNETDTLFDRNGFLVRPSSLGIERVREYDVTYLGLNGDGHFGRLNLTASAYLATGDSSPSQFNGVKSDIWAGFAAAEFSMDFDWIRYRLSALWASGDEDPFDDEENGFDAIFENPLFAGNDTSYWIRQNVPFVGGGGVALAGRNGVLASLRSSKEQGQANFINPGIRLLGFGADMDLTPQTRISGNLNGLWFDEPGAISVYRNQGKVDREIGLDASVSVIWRPLASQNIVLRFSAASLIPGAGFKNLFGDDKHYSVLTNLVFTY